MANTARHAGWRLIEPDLDLVARDGVILRRASDASFWIHDTEVVVVGRCRRELTSNWVASGSATKLTRIRSARIRDIFSETKVMRHTSSPYRRE